MLGEGERLWISEQAAGTLVRLKVGGELDMATAGALRERLLELGEEGRGVRLDLSELGFVDSSGLQALLAAATQFRDNGLEFAVEPQLQPQVVRLFTLVQVHGLLADPAA